MKRRLREDRGSVAAFTAIFSLAAFALAGLLIDGGMAIHGRERAYDIAEQAARAGADNIDEDALRETGEPVIAADTACEDRVRPILEKYADEIDVGEAMGTCQATEEEVTITVTKRVPLTLLRIVWNGEFTMQGTATAHPQDGV